jgi:hypothetical protein
VAFGYAFSSLTFSDGTEIQLPERNILVLVGPNNAGKSAALRNILGFIQAPPEHRRPEVIVNAIVTKNGTPDDFVQWLEHNAFVLNRSDGRYFRRTHTDPVREDIVRNQWGFADSALPTVWPYVAFHAAADQRLALLQASGAYDPLNDAPSTPMQILFARPELEETMSETSFEAFGVPLTLSRIWGSQLDLHVGGVDTEPTIVPSSSYMEEIQSLPSLQTQGDGMRSFLGLMLALITAQYPVLLVDEPEAFLHPPQARLLGRKLAAEAPERTQVFVATHSLEVLQGLLDPAEAPVTVVRLTREGTVNPVAVLPSGSLQGLWRDPLLRYSNVLQGLFHQGVVVCESDSDSRFYAAVLDVMREEDQSPPHDLLFSQSGGKQRLLTVVRALRAVRVPTRVVADIDLLREVEPVRALVEALDGRWDEEVETDLRVVQTGVSQLGASPLTEVVREAVTNILNGADTRLSREDAARIRDAARVEDGWARVKRGGIAALPQGDVSQRANRLLDTLAQRGVYVVPVGELERWVPEIGGHGPSWVSAVLDQNRHADPTLGARTFIQAVANSF